MVKITAQELSALEADSMQIVDIRDEDAFSYGHIPGAINIPVAEIDKINFS